MGGARRIIRVAADWLRPLNVQVVLGSRPLNVVR